MNISPLSFRALNPRVWEKKPIEPIIETNKNKFENYNIKKPSEYLYESHQKYNSNIFPKYSEDKVDETTYEKSKNAARFMAKRFQSVAKELRQIGLDTFEEYRQLIAAKVNGANFTENDSSFLTYSSKDKSWSAARYQSPDSKKLIDFMSFDSKTGTMRIFKMNNGSPVTYVFKDNVLSRITRPETYDTTHLVVEYDLDDDTNYKISLPRQNNLLQELDPFSCEFKNDKLSTVTVRVEDYEHGACICKQSRYVFN